MPKKWSTPQRCNVDYFFSGMGAQFLHSLRSKSTRGSWKASGVHSLPSELEYYIIAVHLPSNYEFVVNILDTHVETLTRAAILALIKKTVSVGGSHPSRPERRRPWIQPCLRQDQEVAKAAVERAVKLVRVLEKETKPPSCLSDIGGVGSIRVLVLISGSVPGSVPVVCKTYGQIETSNKF